MKQQRRQIYDKGLRKIYVVHCGVLDIKADAIVNAANTSLLGGGGVDGAIHRAAGTGLLSECRKLGGCATGSAKITGAYNIKGVRHVIHAVGPVWSGNRSDAIVLASCYTTSLDLALAADDQTVAFPCISCGVYGYPIQDAAKVAISAVSSWLDAHPDLTMTIYLCCYRQIEYDTYLATLS